MSSAEQQRPVQLTINERSRYQQFLSLHWASTTYLSPSGNWLILCHFTSSSIYKWESGGPRRFNNLPKDKDTQMNSWVEGTPTPKLCPLRCPGRLWNLPSLCQISHSYCYIFSCLFLSELQNYEITHERTGRQYIWIRLSLRSILSHPGAKVEAFLITSLRAVLSVYTPPYSGTWNKVQQTRSSINICWIQESLAFIPTNKLEHLIAKY